MVNPEVVLVEFLREHLTDPRARDTTTETQTFSGDGSTTTFSLTIPGSGNHLSAITALTVGGTAQEKWAEYYIDLQNKQIIFYTAPASGTENISVTFKYGTNWIDFRRASDKENAGVYQDETDWPRVIITLNGGPSNPLGQHGADQEDVLLWTVEARAKEDYYPTINGTKYNSVALCDYLVRQAKKYLRTDIEDLYPELYDFRVLTQPRSLPFDKRIQCDTSAMDLQLRGLNTGE